MQLVLDLGNTQSKIAFFDGERLIDVQQMPGVPEQLPTELVTKHPFRASIISSVVNHSSSLEQQLMTQGKFIRFTHETALPVSLRYETPETLGLDRLANAVAAQHKYPEQDVLVLDAGTCLKYDLVTGNGEYHGGAISPGLQMRFQALHTLTDKLPLYEGYREAPLIGRSTEGSIRSGVQNGMIMEIEGSIAAYRQQYPNLVVCLTGGDRKAIALGLNSEKKGIFAHDFLTLEGLNAILLQHGI